VAKTLKPAVALVLVLTALAARATAYDPSLRFETIETSHFEIHFHDGTRELAQRVANMAEEAFKLVAAALEHIPESRIQIVLTDHTDSANGWASVLPYNRVALYASPPGYLSELGDYDDYMWILITHELVHIIHMDTVSGIPAVINLVLGRTAFPNGAQPTWFTEGLAVHYETRFSSAGRIRSSLYRMYLRTAALAGVFPGLDQVSGVMKDWPQGNAPYLYGSFFVRYLTQRFGETSLADLSHHMSGMLVPWTLNIVARKEIGQDYPTLYEDWKQSVERETRATLARLQLEGLTPFEFLTRRGQHQRRPRVAPGSHRVLSYRAPVDRLPTLRLIDENQDRLLFEVNGNSGAAFTPDGQAIVFSQPQIVDEFYAVNDLYIHHLANGKTRRITHGARASAPDVSPDGRTVVFVRKHCGKTRLMTLDLQQGASRQAREILHLEKGIQVYTPRFSPDGRRIVFSVAPPGGGRSIVMLDRKSGRLRRLTRGGHMDIGPVFSHDGKRVYFSSDRSGIYNIHAVDPETREIWRMTNVATGAFSPDPAGDGSGMAFVIYGPAGYDIAWLELPLDTKPSVVPDRDRPPPPATTEDREYPTKAYTPWSTLWPRAWFPVVGSDTWGETYGLMVSGRDVLGKLDYRLELSYGPQSEQVYFDLGVAARVIYPTLYFYTGRHVYRYYNDAVVNGYSYPVDKEHLGLYFDLAFPFSKIAEGHLIFFNYDLNLYERWTEVPSHPWGLGPILPEDDPLAWLGIGWSYSCVHRYTHSISPEEGFSMTLSFRYSNPSIGSGFKLYEARFWFRTYFPVLRRYHHVLAFGLKGGITLGDPRRKHAYGIGGLPVSDPFQDAYFGYRYGGLYLRGYPRTAFIGSMFALGSVEYRFPILDIETGVLTLPFYLRRLHAAVFVDVGGTAIDSPSLDMLKVGLGGELRLDMYLAYYMPMTLRVGFARGLSDRGTNNFFLTMGWGF